MKLLFTLLLMAAQALAHATVLTCQVDTKGAPNAKAAYVELDPSVPSLALYQDYSRANGPIYFVKSDLISNSYLSSWKVERSSENCAFSASTSSIHLNFRCENVNQFSDLQVVVYYDPSTVSGHYYQRGLTSEGREMNFEFDFLDCH